MPLKIWFHFIPKILNYVLTAINLSVSKNFKNSKEFIYHLLYLTTVMIVSIMISLDNKIYKNLFYLTFFY